MSTLISTDTFKTLFPKAKNPDVWVMALNETLLKYNITAGPRLWMFLAQCGHESGGFSILRENLNYSAQGLLKIFPRYFNEKTAEQYARVPAKIANRVYGGRMGNGSESSGDGWKYSGRGVIQLTGKDNYVAFSLAHFKDLRAVDNPDMLLDPFVAVASACWYWNSRKLNVPSDKEDIATATKLINGGLIGLEDRKKEYAHVKKIMAS